MYFELHDILYLVSLLNSKHEIDLNTIIQKNQDYDSLKISLTHTYWKFFNRNFAENNLCMRRILCWCGNCNPPGKLTNL